ncbi:glycosyltransferase [Tabrizicola oligotrophica]|uniref:Chitooligosaccharide deacetylase n=1 Tax=Tabrizicola oligotrophica TaxID=2710650 RepID=A0A6M0QW85_9RHOB|nr:glycosyltransferase [Tabrizicola oligotrophica]NEY91746.1 glycosyltransferase [Tabrizicola oligotrophica]
MLLIWIAALVLAVLNTTSERSDVATQGQDAQQSVTSAGHGGELKAAGLLIDAKAVSAPYGNTDPAAFDAAPERPRCLGNKPGAGAAIAAPGDLHQPRIYALLPSDVPNAFLSLLRNCNQIDIILPELFEIGGSSLGVSPVAVDAELQEALGAIQSELAGAVGIWPIFGLNGSLSAEAFLERLADEDTASGLANIIVRSALAVKAQGACLRLADVKAADEQRVADFLAALSARARESGIALCLVAALSDQQWSNPAFTGPFDTVIVSAYQEPWIGSYPQPLAPLDWFRQQVQAIKARVPAEKLVVAVGGHAVDWISGKAIPERISLAEAMFRISEAHATIGFSPTARNSHSAFFDRAGNRHQIWMLDAASVRNNMKVLQDQGIAAIAVPSLGEEEPAYWKVLDRIMPPEAMTAIEAPAFPDNVVYTGEGAFYRLASAGSAGRRLWHLDAENGFVQDQQYEAIPRAVHMERFGRRNPRQIALTFDDGPNPEATGQILDALKAEGASATFFVVGTAALAAPELLQRAVDEGHVIGSHSFSHPHMDDLNEFMVHTELNANRSVIEGVIGRSPLLYRPPYMRGPGPLSQDEAKAFTAPKEEGYITVGSDIVPTDWQGLSAAGIVRQVIDELEKGGGNVIVLHDGRSTGMHTAEAVRMLIPELRARGYEIVPVADLLGMTTDAVMPRIDLPDSLFKGFSVSLITLSILLLTKIFWLCILASFLRSALYLFLSARRDPTYPRSFAPPPTVTVVVPAYNEEKVIVSTVRSVLGCDYPGLSCIVVDDGSTDATLARLNAAFKDDPRVRILTQANKGKWQALNLAFQSIDSEIAVCVDADTRIARDAIAEIVRPFTDRKVAAVAGTVVVANATNLLTRFQSIEYTNAQQIGRRAHEHLNGILVVPGALGAWRVEAVRDVGLFSNETLTEDADLTVWLRRAGYRIAYAENARSFTEAPTDVRSLLKQRLRWSLGNLQTLWKHRAAFLEFDLRRAFSLLDMVFFGYVLPVLSPVLDIMFLYFLTTICLDWYGGRTTDGLEVSHLSLVFVLLVQALDIAVACVAHRREGWPIGRLVYRVPLMNLLYRPLLYITVYRALWAALSGRLARWNKLHRHGLEPRVESMAR